MRMVLLIFCYLFLGCRQGGDFYKRSLEKPFYQKTLSGFDSIMLKNAKTENIVQSYIYFNDQILTAVTSQELFEQFETIKPECNKLISQLENDSAFFTVWKFIHGTLYDDERNPIDARWIVVDSEKDFFRKLRKISEQNKFYLEYADAIEISQAIPPTIIHGFPHALNLLDLNNEYDRLLFAVHYLTVNSEKKTSSQIIN